MHRLQTSDTLQLVSIPGGLSSGKAPSRRGRSLKDSASDVTRQNGLGWQTQQQWQALADMLAQHADMKPVDVSQAFTTQILEAARK